MIDSHAYQTSSEEKARAAIWLWHRRLGHLSFGYLRKLQPHLFSVLNYSDFHCNICELTRSHCVPFLSSLNKSLEPFVVYTLMYWELQKFLLFLKLVTLLHLMMNVQG